MTTAPSLKNSLTNWFGFPKIERAFAPLLTRASANKVTKRLENVQPRRPSNYDLGNLYKRVLESWRRHASIDRLDRRDLRRLPWVLFYSPQNDTHWEQNDPTDWLGAKLAELGINHEVKPVRSNPTGWLGAELGIVRQYSRWLSDNHGSRAVLSLLHEFLRAYPVDLKTFEDLRRLLKRAIEDSSSPPPSLLKWKQRCLEFGLLKENGSLSFVRKLVSATGVLDEALTRAGLDAGLAHCGFLKSGIRKYLPAVSRLLAQDGLDASQIDRVIWLLECEGKLRFDERSVRREIASALLHPFVDPRHRPDAKTKERLQSFFLHHFRDPRLGSGRHKWSGVPEDIRHVITRWLVEESLDAFFLLIKETAFDKHWRYREKFWRAYFRQDMIPGAWFVLGSRASRLLKGLPKQSEIKTGKLVGAKSDQSVLLLRMFGVTVAEWSHEGSCRIWLDDNSDAPELYRTKKYSGFELRRGSDFSQRHDHSDCYEWQDRIAQWMRENTGASLEREEYTLKQLETTPKLTKQPQVPWRKPPWRKRQVRWRR